MANRSKEKRTGRARPSFSVSPGLSRSLARRLLKAIRKETPACAGEACLVELYGPATAPAPVASKTPVHRCGKMIKHGP